MLEVQALADDYFEPGYIVRLPNDTLRGLVMIKEHAFNTRNCIFKETSEGKELTYLPGEIVAYGTAKKYFRSFSRVSTGNETSTIFIEAIFIGKVNLFFNNESYFIQHRESIEELVEVDKEISQDGKIFRVRQPLYRSTLLSALSDCPTIHKDVVKTTLSRRPLINLFQEYHNCIGASAKATVSENEIAVRWGFSLGAMYSELEWKSNNSPAYLFMNVTPFPSNVSFTPSVWVELWRPGLNRFRARITTNYYAQTYQQTFESNLAGLRYDFSLATSRIDLGLQLKYQLIRKGPYVFGGVSLGKFLSWEDKLTIRTYPGNAFVQENTSLIERDVVVQICGGLGFEQRVGNRSIIIEADTRLTLAGISKSVENLPPQ